MSKILQRFFFLLFLFVGVAAHAQTNQNVNLIYNWYNPNFTTTITGGQYSDTWGFVSNGREYGVIGSTWGTHVFDVTDASNIYQVDSIAGRRYDQNVVWRDFHEYKGYLYCIADRGAHSLQIIDLSYLPDSVHKIYDRSDVLEQTHNIFIDTAEAMLYACGPGGGAAMKIYSLADPTNPVFVATFNNVTYIHDCYVRAGIAYLNCAHQGFHIYDFQDPTNPILLGNLTTYDFQGYNHSGWLTNDGDYYVFGDESQGRPIRICDVSDPTDIKIISEIASVDGNDTMIVHNLLIKDDYLYVSYYGEGFQIFDISNPSQPYRTGFFDTYNGSRQFGTHGAWGVYPYLPSGKILLSDKNSGFYVFDVTGAITPSFQVQNENPSQFTFMTLGSVLTVNFLEEMKQGTLSLIATDGKILRTFSLNQEKQQTFSIKGLPKGMHFISVRTNMSAGSRPIFIK